MDLVLPTRDNPHNFIFDLREHLIELTRQPLKMLIDKILTLLCDHQLGELLPVLSPKLVEHVVIAT